MGTPISPPLDHQRNQDVSDMLLQQEGLERAEEEHDNFLQSLDDILDLIDAIQQVMTLNLAYDTLIQLRFAFHCRMDRLISYEKTIKKSKPDINTPIVDGAQPTGEIITLRSDAGASVQGRSRGIRKRVRPNGRPSRR